MNTLLKPVQAPRRRSGVVRAALLRDYMPAAQRSVINAALRGEDGSAFGDRLDALAATVRRLPKLYETDGQGGRAIASMHWFTAAADWWLVELDPTGRQAFGLCALDPGFDPELGYFSLPELLAAGAELDLHWHPVPVARIRADRQAAGWLAETSTPSTPSAAQPGLPLPAPLPFAPADVAFVEAIESAAGELALAVFDSEAELLALWDGIECALDRWPDLRTCLRAPAAGHVAGWPAPHTGAAAQARYDALTETPRSYKVVSRWSADRGFDPREQSLATGPALIWIHPPQEQED